MKYDRLAGRQTGQSMVEYVVVCTALALALGVGLGSDDSALWQLIQNFRLGYQKFSFALSLPT
ncbi:hypothetical protein E6C76_10915 [Pseudothauera nasutitermitis]|uniref:Uncharacterized protein n=1 Tax=Pseudothauera nasutitermitis TaxID=2565930 RepID=A0A4S4B112_9RHOO|nr:hypothetical protein [Pseudothauera nasutitermitis]THF64568.1 hypothetical protein E6C76_10915 [Pseudothauera nasutitermitis]